MSVQVHKIWYVRMDMHFHLNHICYGIMLIIMHCIKYAFKYHYAYACNNVENVDRQILFKGISSHWHGTL